MYPEASLLRKSSQRSRCKNQTVASKVASAVQGLGWHQSRPEPTSPLSQLNKAYRHVGKPEPRPPAPQVDPPGLSRRRFFFCVFGHWWRVSLVLFRVVGRRQSIVGALCSFFSCSRSSKRARKAPGGSKGVSGPKLF